QRDGLLIAQATGAMELATVVRQAKWASGVLAARGQGAGGGLVTPGGLPWMTQSNYVHGTSGSCFVTARFVGSWSRQTSGRSWREPTASELWRVRLRVLH